MARKPKPGSKPSFFKILTRDFTCQLKLPFTFVRKYGETLPKRCKLITSYGQQAFDVRIEKTNDGKQCCFTGSGWSQFVKDLGFEIGDIVIMWFDGKSEFVVSVFGTNGIEKETFTCKPEPVEFSGDEDMSKKQGSENEANEAGETAVVGDELRPQFELVLKKSQKYRTTLPFGFALKAGLVGANAVVLKYLPNKTHWAVMVERRKNNWHEMYSGWSKFCKENGLIVGNTYSFTFNPVENVIQVVSVRKK